MSKENEALMSLSKEGTNMETQERRQKLLDLLLEHDARDADLLVRKIEKLYGKAR